MMIRKARIKDIPHMYPLWLELMDYHVKLYPQYYKRNKNATMEWKKWIRRNIYGKNSQYLVAEQDGEIVGYIGGNIEKRPPCFAIKENGYVLAGIITKKHRRKGIGNKLLSELMKWFRSKKVKFVELRASARNTAGIKAWEKMGFKDNLRIMIRNEL